jgi:hypothetical protein
LPSALYTRKVEGAFSDANVTYVEEHLAEIGGSTLPRNFWCPWSSRLFAEVTKNIDPVTEKPIGPFPSAS